MYLIVFYSRTAACIFKASQVTSQWIAVVLSPLTMTMAVQFVAPPSTHVVTHVLAKLTQYVLGGRALTQNQLNAVYEAPQLKLAASYGEALLGVRQPFNFHDHAAKRLLAEPGTPGTLRVWCL